MSDVKHNQHSKKNESNKEVLLINATCINCDSPLGLDQQYCASCGGKRIYNRLTWRNLIEDFIDRFLNIENSLFRTFIDLFKRPEAVILGYIKGVRKKYVPAFNYFAIALTIAGIFAFVAQYWFMDDMLSMASGINANTVPSEMKEMNDQMTRSFMKFSFQYQGVIYFVLLPILTVLSSLIFWNYRTFNLVEQFVVYLYIVSHIAIVSSLVSLFCIWNSSIYLIYAFLLYPFMLGYTAYVLKRIYALTLSSIVLKTFFFLALIGVLFTGTSIGFGAYVAYRMHKGDITQDDKVLSVFKNMQESKELKKKKALENVKKTTKDSLP